jgi:integrase
MVKKKQVGNGSGTVYPRKNKDDKITSYLGAYHTADGKRRTVSAKTKTECREKLRKAMSDAGQGIVFDAKGQTVEAFLEGWLEDIVKPSASHRTYATHRQQVRSHVAPSIGTVKLEALRKAHIDHLYADLLRGSDGKRPLAPSSVRRVHAVLHAGLEEAVRSDLIPRNPAAHANKPKVKQEEIEPLDTEQALTLLNAARGDRFEALYVLCLTAGLRQGEALGLKWRSVDLDAGTLRVERQLQRRRGENGEPGRLEFSEPKNASRRTVGLPQRAVDVLRSHRKRQSEDKLRAGALWEDHGLVFASTTGKPVDSQNVVNRYFKPLLERAGLPAIRFHDLRHSCLSLLAQRGEPIRDLQALAGHSTAAFTLQRYTHHYDSSARRTADTMGAILSETSQTIDDV